MGNQKQKWTAEEEDALLAGVAKHGPGKWKNILKDPEFAPFLTHRSNIDLKVLPCSLFFHSLSLVQSPISIFLPPVSFFPVCQDKWRNLSVSTGSAQGSKDKVRNPKLKAIAAAPVFFFFPLSHSFLFL